MFRNEIRPGDVQRAIENQFGEFRKPVTDLHDWQIPAVVSDRNPKQGGTLKLRENFDLTLTIECFDVFRALVEIFAHVGRIDRCRMQPRVQQFVEQQRVSCDFLCQECAVFAQTDEASQNRRILIQQRNVSTAPQYFSDDSQYSLENEIGRLPFLQHQHQQWHEAA